MKPDEATSCIECVDPHVACGLLFARLTILQLRELDGNNVAVNDVSAVELVGVDVALRGESGAVVGTGIGVSRGAGDIDAGAAENSHLVAVRESHRRCGVSRRPRGCSAARRCHRKMGCGRLGRCEVKGGLDVEPVFVVVLSCKGDDSHIFEWGQLGAVVLLAALGGPPSGR